MIEVVFIIFALIIGGVIGYLIGDISLRIKLLKRYKDYSDYNCIQTKDFKEFLLKK